MAWLFAAFVFAILSCGPDVTAPHSSVRYARGISFNPVFPHVLAHLGEGGTGLVPFDRVHIVLHHADGTIALDTMVNFPAGAESIALALVVPLADGAPDAGEDLSMNLGYVNTAGDVVFEGGPVTVNAQPYVPGAPPPPPVSIPVAYTGQGASATSVDISPRSVSVLAGGGFAFTAVARDASGAVIPGTPIVWTSLDPALATIASPGSGAGVALNTRGTAHISAQLLTGPADNVTVVVSLPASAIAVGSGSGQTAFINQPLTQPLVALVTANDGVGVEGVTVTFAAATGGGSVGTATATTDATGRAQTTARLGATVGAQTFTATAAGLAGSPVTFAATATLPPATQLGFATQPASSIAGAILASVVVTARDANNITAVSFNGPVTIALGANPGTAALSGTATVNAVAGVATFSTLSLNRTGTGYALVATASALTSATSSAFNINAGAPASIKADSGDAQDGTAGVALVNPFVARVFDALGNAVPGATVTWTVTNGSGTLSAFTTTTDASGRARTTLTLGGLGTNIATASVSGVVPGASFSANAAPGDATQLVFTVQPSNTAAGASITPAIVVQALDAFGFVATSFTGNVTLAMGANPGASTLGGTVTRAAVAGVATFNNISLNKVGTGYTLVVSSAGLAGATSTSLNVGVGAPASLVIVAGNAQTTSVNTAVAIAPSVRVSDASGNLVAGVAVTFAPIAGSGVVTGSPAVTNASGIATIASWTLGAIGGAQTMIASAGLLSATFHATANQPPSLTSVTPSDVDAVFGVVPVTLSGLGFVAASTAVSVTGGVVVAANIVVRLPSALDADFHITGGAATSALNVSVTTALGTSNSIAFNLYSVANAPLQLGASHGGGGGSPYSLDCAAGSVATGLNVHGGSNVDQVGVICQTVTGAARTFGAPTLTGTAGGTGGSPATLSCPANYVLTGLTGNIGNGGGGLNDLIAGVCTPVGGGANVVTASIGSVFAGSIAYTELCPAGLVMTGIQGGAGNLVDRTQIKCQ